MAKYDVKDDLKEKQTRIIRAVDLLLSLDKREINYYLKKRLLYLLNPDINEYCEYKTLRQRENENKTRKN